jgi:hypothetical protein
VAGCFRYSWFILKEAVLLSTSRMRKRPRDDSAEHAHDSRSSSSNSSSSLRWQTAKHALRCLIGCNIGEGVGAAIGFVLGWDMISTFVLAIGLAFAIGYAFTIIPMLKTMPLRQAARVTVIGDTASITAMEITENSLGGLGIILPAGYAVAYPAMFWAMKREEKRGGMQTHHH